MLFIPAVGTFQDDGLYLATAKSLAEDQGYSIQSLPQPLPQTKYPPLFPLLISLIWRLCPQFPDNLPFLRLVSLACTWGWVLLVWKFVSRDLGRREAAIWIAGITLTCPMTTYLSASLLSEPLFAFTSTLCIVLVVRLSRGSADATYLYGALIGLAAAAAFNTRTIGVALFPVVLLDLLRNRRWRCMMGFCLTIALFCLPWLLWQSGHPIPEDPLLAYYTKGSYAGWNVLNGGTKGYLTNVVGANLMGMLMAPLALWQVSFPWSHLAGLMLTIASGVGLFRIVASRFSACATWVIATSGVLLFWAWPPFRFLAPLIPFLLIGIVLSAPWPAAPSFRYLGRVLATCMILWGVFCSSRNAIISQNTGVSQGPFGHENLTWRDMRATHHWLMSHAPSGAVLAATLDSQYWLYSQRKTLIPFVRDPFKLMYVSEERELALGDNNALRSLLEKHRIEFLIFEDATIFAETEPFRRQIKMLREDYPEYLSPVFHSPTGRVVIYRVATGAKTR